MNVLSIWKLANLVSVALVCSALPLEVTLSNRLDSTQDCWRLLPVSVIPDPLLMGLSGVSEKGGAEVQNVLSLKVLEDLCPSCRAFAGERRFLTTRRWTLAVIFRSCCLSVAASGVTKLFFK